LLLLVETFSAPGDVVLDPFAGSGSTLLLAARMLGRRLRHELDARYHAIASRRFERAAAMPRGDGAGGMEQSTAPAASVVRA